MVETLLLKWGTLKAWRVKNARAMELLQKYHELGSSMSAAEQRDTPEQKQIICDLIDCIDGEIRSDWSGETLSKEDAKKYVLEYRN
jgi:hypothetical protein